MYTVNSYFYMCICFIDLTINLRYFKSLYWVPFGQPSKIGSLELLYHVKGDWCLTMFLTTHKPTNKHTYQNQLQNNDFANCKLLPGKRAMKICVDSFFQAEISIPPEYKVGVHCY